MKSGYLLACLRSECSYHGGTERREILGHACTNDVAVDYRGLICPMSAGVNQIVANTDCGREPPASDNARGDQNPWPVAYGRDHLSALVKLPDSIQHVAIATQLVRRPTSRRQNSNKRVGGIIAHMAVNRARVAVFSAVASVTDASYGSLVSRFLEPELRIPDLQIFVFGTYEN